MRWLRRTLLFWAISTPLFYLFGLPALLDYVSAKVRRDNYAQCIDRLTSDGTMGSANSPLSQPQGDSYCHCVSDGLTFTQNDVWDAVQKKPPAALTAMAQTLADQCGRELRTAQGLTPAAEQPLPAHATGEGNDVIYITP